MYRVPDDPDKNEITKSVFILETTVHGGTNGVKLFLKNEIMESVYKWEDSSKQTLSMETQNMYINDKSVIKDYSFRNIKMYGTIFNYPGYMANAGYTTGCCVPQFIFDTLHDPNEKNPRKEIAILTMKNVSDASGMQTEDEGCCISQIADLCQKRKVICYAMDFKHKLFETNKDTTPANNLPRLIFICANNHLYPITDAEQRDNF